MVRRSSLALLVGLGLALVGVSRPAFATGLETVGGVQVLVLDSGVPGERGRMHGQLLAKEILEALGELEKLRGDIVPGGEKQYLQILEKFTLDPEYEAEVDGIVDGVRDALGADVKVPGTERAFDRTDVLALNTLCDLLPFACSSFTVTGAKVEGGGTLTARNLDYRIVGSTVLKRRFVLVHPARKGRHGWATVTWPGLIGCYTGMNDEGVTASIHDVPTPAEHLRRGGDLTPRAIGLRKVLERTGKGDKLGERAAGVLKECKVVYGTNVHVSGPGASCVLEWDPQRGLDGGVSVRTPEPGEPLVCTNHFRKRARATDCDRFAALTKALEGAQALSPKRALALLRVAAVRSADDLTVHSVVFSPEERKALVAFARDASHAACDGEGTLLDLGAIFDHPEARLGPPARRWM